MLVKRGQDSEEGGNLKGNSRFYDDSDQSREWIGLIRSFRSIRMQYWVEQKHSRRVG